jgi:hypothetical protein
MKPAGWRWGDVVDDQARVERRSAGQRVQPIDEHQDGADREQQHGDVRPDGEEAADRPIEVGCGTAVRARGHEKARSSIWKAV